MDKFAWPTLSDDTEVGSLLNHARLFQEVPSPDYLPQAIDVVCARYPSIEHPASQLNAVTIAEWVDAHLPTVLQALNMQSSPGVPFCTLGMTNEILLSQSKPDVVRAVRERFMLLTESDPDVVKSYTAEELVQKGFCDPVRVFVKNEPHKLHKVKEHMERLISSVSVVDQVIERLLHSFQNQKEIVDWPSNPSMPGMGLDDMKASQLVEVFSDQLAKTDIVSSDIGRYDWTVQAWDLEADLICRLRLGGVVTGSPLYRAMYNRFHCLSLSVFATSRGTFYAQSKRGVMKSGCYITSSGDSRIRAINAHLVGADWSVCMGDDAVEAPSPNKQQMYAKLGKRLKSEVTISFGNGNFQVEFCSHNFRMTDGQYSGIVPVNPAKVLMRLLSQQQLSPELIAQYIYYVRHVEFRGGIVQIMRVLHALDCFKDMPVEQEIANLAEIEGNVLNLIGEIVPPELSRLMFPDEDEGVV